MAGINRMKNNMLCVFVLFGLAFTPALIVAESEADWFAEFEQDTETVNEGGLIFLEKRPKQPVHYLHNRITITPESLTTGWVRLSQCHEQLDSVPAAQIVFNPQRIRHLSVTSKHNIEAAWVDGPSVQLKQVSKQAKVCIDAETRAFNIEDDGKYRLRNGPFMRRFLDGFYPMRLRLDVSFPNQLLRLVSVSPNPQSGFRLQQEDGKVSIETLFEGKLYTELLFSRQETRSE